MTTLTELTVALKRETKSLWAAMPRWYTGRVTQVSPLLVDAGGDTDVTPIPAGGWAPILGQPVTCLAIMGRVLAWPKDPATGLPSSGTITAVPPVGSTTVQVAVGSAVMPLTWLSSYTPIAVGDRVAIAWNPYKWGDGWVAGKLGAVPVSATPPTVAGDTLEKVTPVAKSSGIAVVSPLDARSWRDGWRGDTLDLVQGLVSGYPVNSGFLFFGDRFTAHAGVTVTGVDAYMHRSPGAAGTYAAVAPVWQRHTSNTRPSSKPALTGATVTGTGYQRDEYGWRSEPGLVPVVQSLINYGGGLAIVADTVAGYSRWLSPLAGAKPRDPLAGSIRFAWERTT